MRGGSANAPLHRRVSLVALALLGLVGGCSLAVDERVTPLDQGAIPDDLTEPTTTTTTTTTAPPTTTPPDDTSVGSVDTTTSTQPVIPTETITVYYTRGLTDVMQPVGIPRAIGTPVAELIPLLERPTGISEAGLRTSVLSGMIDEIFVERGTATVLLDQDILDRMSDANLRRAIAQIVLTLTSFVTADAGAIGFVRFEVDGEGFSVFVPGFGGTSERGEPLAFTDFSVLISTTPTPVTTIATTTTSTAPGTTTDTVADPDEGQ